MHLPLLIRHWLSSLLPGEISASEYPWLFDFRRHMPLIVFRRAQMIRNRVRLLALLFAVLTPLWIVVDTFLQPPSLWLELAMLRLLATAGFITLLTRLPPTGRARNAYKGLALLLAIPTLFYLVSYGLLSRHHLQGIAAAIATGYAFLPFVLLAALAIFPLTLLETLAYALPVVLASVLALASNSSANGVLTMFGQLWLLCLLTGVAGLASMSQLAFMIALVNQTIHDPLTGAFSRRSGEELLSLQYHYALRSNAPLAVAFLDLDHFKMINDRYGHEAGDQVLQGVSPAVSSHLRHGDILIRWGGEEFLLLLPNTPLEQAGKALARLLGDGVGVGPDGAMVTCSIGLAERRADGLDSWRTLVELADSRMYEAKRQGRNRMVSGS